MAKITTRTDANGSLADAIAIIRGADKAHTEFINAVRLAGGPVRQPRGHSSASVH